MGILDRSYSFFITRALNAALYFKLKQNICVVGGDPLCSEELYPELLAQFGQYRQKHSWGIIFFGASDEFASYATRQQWTTIQISIERVLNPVTNLVLREVAAKRIASQNRQLLHPSKGGVTVGVYNPSVRKDKGLETQLVTIYEAWREARNETNESQVFITVYDPFAIPCLMTYIYTMDRLGTPNGFAALRKLANGGYHIDPCVAPPHAPRGISDLLIFASMSLLNLAGCTYLSLGCEPLMYPGKTNGMPSWAQNMLRKSHKSVAKGIISGKKRYNDKWRPDEEQTSGSHLVFPSGMPGPQDLIAVMHVSNISIRLVLLAKLKKLMACRQGKASAEKDEPAKTTPEK